MNIKARGFERAPFFILDLLVKIDEPFERWSKTSPLSDLVHPLGRLCGKMYFIKL